MTKGTKAQSDNIAHFIYELNTIESNLLIKDNTVYENVTLRCPYKLDLVI